MLHIRKKTPLTFAYSFIIIHILIEAIARILSRNVNPIIYRFLGIQIFTLVIFTIFYCTFLHVALSEQFKKTASKYIVWFTIVIIIIREIAQHFQGEESLFKLARTNWLSGILIICGVIFYLSVIYLINYFLISWGNRISAYFMKHKQLTTI